MKSCYQLITTVTISEKRERKTTFRTNISGRDNVSSKKFLYFGNSPFFRDQWLLLWLLWLILLLVDFADLWLVTSTVRLHVSNYSQLSDYTVRLQLYTVISEKLCSKCTNHIEEIVTVTMNPMLIYMLIVHAHCGNAKIRLLVKLYKYWSADRDLTHLLRHNH